MAALKLRTRITIAIYIALWLFITGYSILISVCMGTLTGDMGFGLQPIVVFIIGIISLVNWIGLAFKQKWAWGVLTVIHILAILLAIHNIVIMIYLTRFNVQMSELLYTILFFAFFIYPVLILITDSPHSRR